MKGSWDARCSGLIYMCEMRVLDGSIPCYRLTHVHSGIVGGKRRRSRACATIAEMRLMICGVCYSVVPRLCVTSVRTYTPSRVIELLRRAAFNCLTHDEVVGRHRED